MRALRYSSILTLNWVVRDSATTTRFGKKHPILVVLGPQRAPAEQMGVGGPDHGDVVPLVADDHVDPVVVHEPQEQPERKPEAQPGEHPDDPTVQSVDPADPGQLDDGPGVRRSLEVSQCHSPLHRSVPTAWSRHGSETVANSSRSGSRPAWSESPVGRLGSIQGCDARAAITYCPPMGSQPRTPSTDRPGTPPSGVNRKSVRVTSEAPDFSR